MVETRYSIIITGDGDQYEALANAAITPGQLVEILSTGKIQKVAAAAGVREKAFAIEDYLQGNDVDDDYVADNRTLYRVFKSGDQVHAILADGQDVAIGAKLESAGGGELRAQALNSDLSIVAPEALVAIAMEAVDAADSSAVTVANRRIKVRIV